MDSIKEFLRAHRRLPGYLLKWALISAALGAAGGLAGSVFRLSIEWATGLREANGWLLWLLPAAGALIALLYRLTGMEGRGTDDALSAAGTGAPVPEALPPVIFAGTVLTHLVGGSAGREGAALQIGGGLGSLLGRRLKLPADGMRAAVLCGMAAVFSALFGTPVTAAVFVLEAVQVGELCYAVLLPALISSLAAFGVSTLFGYGLSGYAVGALPALSLAGMGETALIAAAAGLTAAFFCFALHTSARWAARLVKNPMLRGAAGGALLLALTFLAGTRAYNGGGLEGIRNAFAGQAEPFAFALKLLFTVVSISVGFRGGEIVPGFFIGATLGCVLAPLVGLPAAFGAAIGLVAFFCGSVNCPVASILLGAELFGAGGIPFFALSAAVSYVISGRTGLYGAQILPASKIAIDPKN